MDVLGAKAREQREEAEREIPNRRQASGAYTAPQAAQIEDHHTFSGLSLGGISFRHVVAARRDKESPQSEISSGRVFDTRLEKASGWGSSATAISGNIEYNDSLRIPNSDITPETVIDEPHPTLRSSLFVLDMMLQGNKSTC